MRAVAVHHHQLTRPRVAPDLAAILPRLATAFAGDPVHRDADPALSRRPAAGEHQKRAFRPGAAPAAVRVEDLAIVHRDLADSAIGDNAEAGQLAANLRRPELGEAGGDLRATRRWNQRYQEAPHEWP